MTLTRILTFKKAAASAAAVIMATVILFGTTFAWQSLNQEALNEIRSIANPGGRLHDDFNNVTDLEDPEAVKTYDKNVYVENFTSRANEGVSIYARIRLDEYMEIGTGAGTDTQSSGVRVLDWSRFDPRETELESEFRKYWELDWADGGGTAYMPTFNKNKDSLEADINGSFAEGFADHVDYTVGSTKEGYAVYDNDDNDVDELQGRVKVKNLIETGVLDEAYRENVRLSAEKATHTATETIYAERAILMEDWLQLPAEEQTGDFWVWDTDGWAYWANPIQPGTATGLLLDGVRRTEAEIDGEWYYAINVVAQFITGDAFGTAEQGDGFYNGGHTENALELLRMIGVDVNGSGTVQSYDLSAEPETEEDEMELEAGEGAASAVAETLSRGGKVTLSHDEELEAPLAVTADTRLSMESATVSAAPGFAGDSLISVRSAVWLDLEGGCLQAPENGYGVSVENEGALVYIWDGVYEGGAGAIYVETGEVVIVGGEFSLQDGARGRLIDWDPENFEAGTAGLVIYGGTFYNFDPSDVDGVDLLAEGYRVEAREHGTDTIYTVVEDNGENGTEESETETEENEEPAESAEDTAAPEETEPWQPSGAEDESGLSGEDTSAEAEESGHADAGSSDRATVASGKAEI